MTLVGRSKKVQDFNMLLRIANNIYFTSCLYQELCAVENCHLDVVGGGYVEPW